jgi:D-alanine-D-alanine ligase
MNRICVGILFGGRSGEHEISLLSARSILNEIDRNKYKVVEIGITHEGVWLVGEDVLTRFESKNFAGLKPATLIAEPGSRTIYAREQNGDIIQLTPYEKIDVIFPVTHGPFGEDGSIQGMLEMTDIPFVGAGVTGSAVGMDKAIFKQVMRSNQVPVVDDLVVTRKEIEANIDVVIKRIEEMNNYPFFTKPVNMGSSVGINKCKNREQLREGLLDAAQYDRRVLVEVGIEKPMEIEISVLGNENPLVSVPGEVVPGDEFYSYEDKYINGLSYLIIPAKLPEDLTRKIQVTAVKVFQLIDCAGMARVDFLLDENKNELYLNEINTIPGFTQISMYTKLWEASGLSFSMLIDQLIGFAMERQSENARSIHQYRRRS